MAAQAEKMAPRVVRTDRRLIEEAIPLREISFEAAKEKSIRYGHISTLHIWWARRPLVACRAALLGSIICDPGDEKERRKLLRFLEKFCTWESSNDPKLIDEAQHLLLSNNGGKAPRVLDSFAGGGAIPLEALRLGCDTYASDLNPVSVLIMLATLVYPQKYGRPAELPSKTTDVKGEKKQHVENRLLHDFMRWSEQVVESARSEIGSLYPLDSQKRTPLTYIWARTIRCPNPECGAEFPLIKQLWLSNKPSRKIALKMLLNKKQKRVHFRIVSGAQVDFNPKDATIRLGSAQCPLCKIGTYDKFEIKAAARKMGFGLQPLAVVVDSKLGREYRLFEDADIQAFEQAKSIWNHIQKERLNDLPSIPDEPISTDYDWVLKPPMFGLSRWGEIFNPRQAVALVTFVRKVRDVYQAVLGETGDKEYARIISTYLALAVDRLVDKNATSCLWNSPGEKLEHVFGRQAIPMAWDYGELNPFSGQMGDWSSAVKWIGGVIEHCSQISGSAHVLQSNAMSLTFENGFFDAVIIDPPYYDAVPYADLSDFFYVWLKRSIGDLYRDLFATPLTPKTGELVQQSDKVTSAKKRIKDKNFYESGLTKSLSETNRVLKQGGVCVVAFAHKTIAAWESLIESILSSGFQVTASWPISTERKARLRARSSAALASSVWLVCRKRQPEVGVGSWKKVQVELDRKVRERLDFFLREGIKGADALLAAIGPALEVFGRYESVEKITGEKVAVGEFLDKVREVVAHHALSTVLSEQELGNVDPPTAFYVLWKWTFEPVVQNGKLTKPASKSNGNHIFVLFDDALKIARSVGADPEILLKTHILEQEKENVRLLGPNERKHVPGLGESARDGTAPSTIDVIHKALNLWAAMEQAQLEEYLEKSGARSNETFWRVAQALSNLLPMQSKEKQLLDGLLARHAGGGEILRPRDLRSLDEFVKKEEK